MRASDVDDGTATVQGVPVAIGQRWAKKTDVSDGERMRAAQHGQILGTRFLVRSDTLTRTITGRDTIECEGRLFEVVGTKERDGRKMAIEITTSSRPDITT